MNARHSAAGDGPADTGNPAADLPDPYQRQIDAYQRQIDALERLITEHETTHKARLETLQRQSAQYLSTLAEEKRLLQERQTDQRQRRSQALHGEDPQAAEALKA